MIKKNTTRKPRPVPSEIAELQQDAAADSGEDYTEADFLAAIDRVKPRPSAPDPE